jgi:hypothetical protein
MAYEQGEKGRSIATSFKSTIKICPRRKVPRNCAHADVQYTPNDEELDRIFAKQYFLEQGIFYNP